MKLFALVSLLCLTVCKQENLHAPPSLTAKTLKGTVTSASGTFAGLEGYQFSTRFVTQNNFETQNASGTLESAGKYDYQKGRLTLQSNAGLHPQETLLVTLKFTDSKSGVYEAHFSNNNPAGEQTGIFSLK